MLWRTFSPLFRRNPPADSTSTSKALALGYTSTDIDVPGTEPASTAVYGPRINNLEQIAGSYFHSDGFPYTGGKSVTIDAP
jgi:hypothetical protein